MHPTAWAAVPWTLPSLSQRPGPGGQQELPGPLLKPSEQDCPQQRRGPWGTLWCTTGVLWGVAGSVACPGCRRGVRGLPGTTPSALPAQKRAEDEVKGVGLSKAAQSVLG